MAFEVALILQKHPIFYILPSTFYFVKFLSSETADSFGGERLFIFVPWNLQ